MERMATKKTPLGTPPPVVQKDNDALVLERRTQRTSPPPMHQVLLLNDDFTPMEFVVDVLQAFFSKDRQAATHIMLQVHMEGRGICGIYSKDIAQTKVDLVLDAARQAGHPLQCVHEPVQQT
jgi:ATP-dependent Clp protease adaptor protein ClpS